MNLTYLDNAATSWPKPPAVTKAMRKFLEQDAGNPGRSGHRMAVACERMLDDLRGRLNRMFDGYGPERVVFTLNATDALNMAIKGVLRPGDHAITTALEHNSVSRPLQAYAQACAMGDSWASKRTGGQAASGTRSSEGTAGLNPAARGIELTRVGMSSAGFVDPGEIESAILPSTRLIACSHCSNVLGTIQPIAEIGRIARKHGVLFLVDAAQSAGLVPIDMKEIGIDLLAIAGHKALLGPPGTGALLISDRVDAKPWREGGTGGDSASPLQPAEYPWRLEGGTPNTVGLAGLLAALNCVQDFGSKAMLAHERALAMQLADAFKGDDRIRMLGSDDFSRRTGVTSLVVPGLSAQEVAAVLDESFGIAVRAGLHCAPYLHRAMGTFPDGAVRISPGPYNTPKDIEMLIEALSMLVRELNPEA